MDFVWLGAAFMFAWLAVRAGQPPLIGYLVAGFALEELGWIDTTVLIPMADAGVLLLLFSIGLKLDIRSLLRPHVWGVGVAHMGVSVGLFAAIAIGISSVLPADSAFHVDIKLAPLIGFALSFSSTVFVVKVLEARGDLGALYGRIAIGILVIQDLAAVLFVAISSGKVPSIWAAALILLIPGRRVLDWLLRQCGHGELLVLAGAVGTFGGAALFDAVGLKGDLGALVMGALLAKSSKAGELAKALFGIKNLLLVFFFLSVGLTGLPTLGTVGVAVILVPFCLLKAALFFWMLAKSRLRARTSLLTAASLANFSEFGLIVMTLAVRSEWLATEWLIAVAMTLALSFLAASAINERALQLYERYKPSLIERESKKRLPEEEPVDASGAQVLVFGMGRVGAGAYDALVSHYGDRVVGFDLDAKKVKLHEQAGRRVRVASATDQDFWERLHVTPSDVELVVLTMTSHQENLDAIELLRASSVPGKIAATARYEDEVKTLLKAGADYAFPVFAEAGAGFVNRVLRGA